MHFLENVQEEWAEILIFLILAAFRLNYRNQSNLWGFGHFVENESAEWHEIWHTGVSGPSSVQNWFWSVFFDFPYFGVMGSSDSVFATDHQVRCILWVQQTPSVYHCLQNHTGYDSDKFIRQSKICMTQSKLVLLGSDYVTQPGLSKSKHQISFFDVLIVKNCQC